MLNHLSTKLLTRRSDIIMTSTLSITLTPKDDFIPISFAFLTPKNIQQWITYRNKFRSEREQCKDHSKDFSEDELDESILVVGNMGEGFSLASSSGFEYDKKDDDIVKHLPRTLLSAPLRPDLTGLLSKKDRRIYNIQKVKWECE